MPSNDKEYQRLASRKHYLGNKEVVKARSWAKKAEMSAYVIRLKEQTPCVDCENFYPSYVMDFDHLPQFEKSKEISRLVGGGSWKKLLDEIDKCDIVCSNCH